LSFHEGLTGTVKAKSLTALFARLLLKHREMVFSLVLYGEIAK